MVLFFDHMVDNVIVGCSYDCKDSYISMRTRFGHWLLIIVKSFSALKVKSNFELVLFLFYQY